MLAALIWCASDASAAVTINNVSVSVLPQPTAFGSGQTQHGYVEYRVALANLSTAEKRVRLNLPDDSWNSRQDQIRSITKTVTLAPGASTVVSLIQPPVMVRGAGLGVSVDGRRQRVPLSVPDHVAANSHGGGFASAVLTSQRTDNRFRSDIQSQLDSMTSSSTSVHQSEVPIDQWSSNWLNYTRCDGVLVTADEMKDAPIGVVEALRRFTMAGGTLVVSGAAWTPPPDWRPHAKTTPGYSEYFCGFGVVVAANKTPIPNYVINSIADHVKTSTQPWRENHTIEGANNVFPVVDDLQVPVKGLLVLMIGFAVAIGPINLWLLAKYKKRMWLLWTVPAFSLLTCLAVWVYATAAEGWSGHERTATITILDQQNMTATTIGWSAFYAPITPGGGLRYELATELTPQIGRTGGSYYYYGRSDGRSRSVDLDEGQHLTNGWVIARVPSHFQVRKPAETVRQRLNFRATGSGLEVVNGLGVDVKTLVYADEQGVVYTAGPIGAGDTATLTKTPDRATANADNRRWMYQNNWVGGGGTVSRVIATPQIFAHPGSYVAILDGEPFLESGLGKPEARKAEAVLLGYVGSNAAGDGGAR